MRCLFLSLFCLPLVAAGCSTFSETDPAAGRTLASFDVETEEEYRAKRAEMVAALDEMIGAAEAADVAACRVVAVGEKACGGPAAFLVYSATASDADAVEALAGEITALDREANRAFDLVSDCMARLEPAPALVDGRCVVKGAR